MLPKSWIFLILIAVTASARAQLRLPALPLQQLPLQTLPQALNQTDTRILDRLSGLRLAAISRLIRDNGRVIEADPNGEPIVRGEILALSPAEAAMSRARSAGFLVAREQTLAAVNLHLIVFTSPSRLSTKRALKYLRESDPDGTYDYNHIYTNSGGSVDALTATAARAISPPGTPSSKSAERPHVRVGLLDTGIEVSHPIFRDSVVHTWGCSNKSIPSLHGTAVASLLLTHASADLYAADVYCGSPTGGAVDAIIAALAWLTSERVPVINVSLVGPKNAMLEKTVAGLIAEGYILVAAVGNDGPTAPPLYPAAYANVVGVTGVDAKRRVLLEALRGPQVTFAAPGADMKAANTEGAFVEVRGTSFAAPAVAELLAEILTTPDTSAAKGAVDTLAQRAIDLGPPGKDLTYGFGLVGAEGP
jgi:subtilisin family serine protease